MHAPLSSGAAWLVVTMPRAADKSIRTLDLSRGLAVSPAALTLRQCTSSTLEGTAEVTLAGHQPRLLLA